MKATLTPETAAICGWLCRDFERGTIFLHTSKPHREKVDEHYLDYRWESRGGDIYTLDPYLPIDLTTEESKKVCITITPIEE